jgi:hypothetical protein
LPDIAVDRLCPIFEGRRTAMAPIALRCGQQSA